MSKWPHIHLYVSTYMHMIINIHIDMYLCISLMGKREYQV